MSVVRLPVSGLTVWLNPPTGVEELLILESSIDDTTLVLTLATRLAEPCDVQKIAWETLTVTDLDVLLLHLHRLLFGERIVSEAICPCGAGMDITFRAEDYLAHLMPRTPRGIVPDAEAGWYQFRDAEIGFRLPCGGDQRAIAGCSAPEKELARRCIRPAEITAPLRRRAQRAMEAMAPSLVGDMESLCPQCGTEVALVFDARKFCLCELRNHAVFLYEDIHVIAATYNWSETEILALPRARRKRYAELARQERRAT